MDYFDHLLYLRVHEGCNLFCEHCFIPANPKRMTMEQIRGVPAIVSGFAARGDVIRVQWHGGEPTLMGVSWLREAIATLEACSSFIWAHDIQSNLMNYSPEWGALYRDHFGGAVGVSWDAGIRLLKKGQPDSFADYDKLFFANLERLIADGVKPRVTITATKVLFRQHRTPFQLLDYFESIGVREMHIERITEVGRARDTWDQIGLSNAEYSDGMSRWLDAYTAYLEGGGAVRLSPFDGMVNAIQGDRSAKGCWSGHCDSRFHTIDANGYKSGCTALNSEYDNKRASGNVIRFVNVGDARALRRNACDGCTFQGLCATGCLTVPSWDNSGECSGARRLWEKAQALSGRTHLFQKQINQPADQTIRQDGSY